MALKGNDFKIQVNHPDRGWITLGGMRDESSELGFPGVDTTDNDDGIFRKVYGQMGQKSYRLQGSGFMKGIPPPEPPDDNSVYVSDFYRGADGNGPIYAYSLRRLLVRGYTGPLFRLRPVMGYQNYANVSCDIYPKSEPDPITGQFVPDFENNLDYQDIIGNSGYRNSGIGEGAGDICFVVDRIYPQGLGDTLKTLTELDGTPDRYNGPLYHRYSPENNKVRFWTSDFWTMQEYDTFADVDWNKACGSGAYTYGSSTPTSNMHWGFRGADMWGSQFGDGTATPHYINADSGGLIMAATRGATLPRNGFSDYRWHWAGMGMDNIGWRDADNVDLDPWIGSTRSPNNSAIEDDALLLHHCWVPTSQKIQTNNVQTSVKSGDGGGFYTIGAQSVNIQDTDQVQIAYMDEWRWGSSDSDNSGVANVLLQEIFVYAQGTNDALNIADIQADYSNHYAMFDPVSPINPQTAPPLVVS